MRTDLHRSSPALWRWPLLGIAAAALVFPARGGDLAPLVIDEAPQPFVARQPRGEAEANRVEAQALFAAGETFQQRQEYDKALRCYVRALRRDPRAATVADAILPLAMHEHAYAAANYAAQAANTRELDPTMLHRVVLCLRQAGEFARAVELYERALRERDTAKERGAEILIRRELGGLYSLLEQHEKAAEQFARVIHAVEHAGEFRIDGRLKEALLGEQGSGWLLFGECFLLANRLDEARAAFEKANAAAPNEALFRFNLARLALRSGNAEQALAGLQPYFDKHLASEGVMPYDTLAEALKKLGKEKELIERLEKLHAADPDNVPLGYFLAGQYEKSGQAEKSEPLYAALVKKSPISTAYRGLARAYRQSGRADALLDLLGDLVENTGLLEVVATEAEAVAGDAELMRRLAETARQRHKDDAKKLPFRQRLALALLALEAKQYEVAAEFFELALADQPKQANEVLLPWGMGLLLDERADEAVKVFQRGVDLAAKDKPSLAGQLLSRLPGVGGADKSANSAAVFHFYLAGALAMAHRDEEALAAARKAAELSKDSPRFAGRVPWILYHAKRYEESIRAYREFIDRYEGRRDSPETRDVLRDARLALSNLYVLTKRMSEAEECLEQVLDEFPEDVGASNDLGYLWADQGKRLETSLEMVRRAVAAEPDNMAYRDSLGWVYYRLGRYAEAVAELEKAAGKATPPTEKPTEKPAEKVTQKPDEKPAEQTPAKRPRLQADEPDGTIFDHLGDSYLKVGQPDRAKEAWRKAAERFRNAKEKDEEKAKEVEKKLLSHE